MSIMTAAEYEALDIYSFLFRTAYGTTDEEIDFRVRNGSNGVINKTLNYIKNKYMNVKDDNNA